MKLKVKAEGRAGVYLVKNEDAIEFVESLGETHIHNMIANDDSIAYIGADWKLDSVTQYLQAAEKIAVVLPAQVGHALVAITGNDRYLFDIGKITENTLEVEKTCNIVQ